MKIKILAIGENGPEWVAMDVLKVEVVEASDEDDDIDYDPEGPKFYDREEYDDDEDFYEGSCGYLFDEGREDFHSDV